MGSGFWGRSLILVVCAFVLNAVDAQCADDGLLRSLRKVIDILSPLHQPLAAPGPHDWLSTHQEAGQTFQEYLKSDPVLPGKSRRVIYIQPLGRFAPQQRRIVARTAEFVKLYYGMPVTIKADLPISSIPPEARRRNPVQGMEQLLAPFVIEELLIPAIPADAAAVIAFTASDLWPGEGWNFVFGLATPDDRVGVWSLHRFGDPAADNESYRRCLSRTIKTAVHEIGHMFSIMHCTAFDCVMNGSNHLAEMDSRPLALCPQCLAKLLYVTGQDPLERFRALADFCRREGLDKNADFYEHSLATLEAGR